MGGVAVFGFIVLAIYFVTGLLFLALAAKNVQNSRRPLRIPAPRFQLVLWGILVLAAIVCISCGQVAPGAASVLAALLLPRGLKRVDISPLQT